MKLYMVDYNGAALMAVGKNNNKYIIPGVLDNCPEHFKSIDKFLNYDNADCSKLRNFIKASNLEEIKLSNSCILAPIPKPQQNIICMGLNYEDHIKESEKVFLKDIKRPKYPIIFTKSSLSINSPYGDIPLRKNVSLEMDWESELAIVIGKPGIHIKKEDVYDYIFGYMVLNDVSARDIQRNHKQFFLGKSLPGACPIGPCLVTKDEIIDPHNLDLSCKVNNIVKQKSNTKYQIFDIPTQIETISKSTYLVPGDIIATGTPSGVGFARTPPEFLKDGDIVECEIEKIGKIVNKVVDQSYQ
ncbi:MAG: fumarylacetoacetate hydrolase family protein [Gammaproteobacteria bacterium]|jgi:2-keto-4-pentenoate hydratase/2-oxohepta-3-ene-1,7-dioic acid hydratase in catechol pathway|nr:fumarylacetoacetate hydrolase family protein [Gammaproteobacteria bacterium]|tara:strand:- start:129 stop:1028 length:900 start_codon:yes stop_codon:yes gene_type:complete